MIILKNCCCQTCEDRASVISSPLFKVSIGLLVGVGVAGFRIKNNGFIHFYNWWWVWPCLGKNGKETTLCLHSVTDWKFVCRLSAHEYWEVSGNINRCAVSLRSWFSSWQWATPTEQHKHCLSAVGLFNRFAIILPQGTFPRVMS